MKPRNRDVTRFVGFLFPAYAYKSFRLVCMKIRMAGNLLPLVSSNMQGTAF